MPADFLIWYVTLTVMVFYLGACIGSFLNVCIYRIPIELSVVQPRSFCPHCRTPIAWYHNIPLVSFLALGARCHSCKARISPRYFLVEFLVAVLFLLVWLKWNPIPSHAGLSTVAPDPGMLGLVRVTSFLQVPVYWLAVCGLVLGTFVDFDHLIIPDRVTLGGIVAGLILSVLVPAMHDQTTALKGLMYSAIGAAVGWGLLHAVAILGQFIFRKEAMGFGDVKLMGAIGAFFGWKATLFTVVLSSAFGALVGIVLVLMKKREMQSKIPYGPYLALAATIWILWGPNLVNAYLRLLIPPEVTL
jgi:leader peptidase (prepilin peptidase) / N-methyltransferase